MQLRQRMRSADCDGPDSSSAGGCSQGDHPPLLPSPQGLLCQRVTGRCPEPRRSGGWQGYPHLQAARASESPTRYGDTAGTRWALSSHGLAGAGRRLYSEPQPGSGTCRWTLTQVSQQPRLAAAGTLEWPRWRRLPGSSAGDANEIPPPAEVPAGSPSAGDGSPGEPTARTQPASGSAGGSLHRAGSSAEAHRDRCGYERRFILRGFNFGSLPSSFSAALAPPAAPLPHPSVSLRRRRNAPVASVLVLG